MECYFGNIKNGNMDLSVIGKLIEKYWNEIAKHFAFVTLDTFIVMPNHIHGIIIIDKGEIPVETPKLGVSNKWKPGTLRVIVNQFKRICTISARKSVTHFGWQSRYWEHIIRNENEYNRIVKYIKDNPQKWDNDKLNSANENYVMEQSDQYDSEIWMI